MMDNAETLPDFGYVVQPGNWRGRDMFAVVWLDAEFGDSKLCICWERAKAKMICDAMNEQIMAVEHGRREIAKRVESTDTGIPITDKVSPKELRRDVVLQACGIDESATIRNGVLTEIRGATATFTDVQYLLVDGANLALARYAPNRPWFEVKASGITPKP